MLMLSRNIGKAVIISGNIRVTVAHVDGCQVRLGIEAPRGVIVDREEIHQRRMADAQPAPAAVDPRDLFIAANPIGASEADLEKGPVSGFVDDRTHADYMIFLAGFNAAQVGQEVPHGL